MKKSAYFDTYHSDGWPDEHWLSRYFLTSEGRHDFFAHGNDSWGLTAEGVDGTEHLLLHKGRIDVELYIKGQAGFGVMLLWRKIGRVPIEAYYSKGDTTRLGQWVKDMQGYLQPVGLFIPFETAWLAVKGFIERDGALPTCIEWIRDRDLPKSTFPPP